MAKKKKLEGLKINLASLVDSPAQEHATILMIKNKDGVEVGKAYVPDGECKVMLTESVDGHQHGVYIAEGSVAGDTSYAGADPQSTHSHAWAVVDGVLTIAETLGHTHAIAMPEGTGDPVIDAATEALAEAAADVVDAITEARENTVTASAPTTASRKIDNADPTMYVHPKETDAMADTDKNTETTKQLEIALAKAVRWGALTDAEKAHAMALPDGERDVFAAKSRADRTAEIAKSADADPVVYTAVDGTVIRKSMGSLAEKQARQIDELSKGAIESAKALRAAELLKRVTTEVPLIKGDDAVKAAMLGALDTITDAEVKKAVGEIMKACNGAFALMTKQTGTTTTTGTEGAGIASDALRTHVTTKAAEMKVPYEVALAKLLGSDKVTRDLYEQAAVERN